MVLSCLPVVLPLLLPGAGPCAGACVQGRDPGAVLAGAGLQRVLQEQLRAAHVRGSVERAKRNGENMPQ